MFDEQTKRDIERFRTAQEFVHDYMSYCNCRNVLHNYNRVNALDLLYNLIQRYKAEINQFGFLNDGVHVIYGVNYDNITDIQIMDQLIYIGQRIAAYAFIREGNKQLANRLLNQIGCSGFII